MASSLAMATAVQRAGAAEGDESEVARIVAAADRDQPHRVRHVGVGDLDDGVAAAWRCRPKGFATPSSTASAASRGSSMILPPARLVPSRPSTTLASVLVGWRLPLP